jgi:hypothetical protein
VKALSLAFIRIALLIGALSLAACSPGAGGTSTGGSSSGGTSSTSPTASPTAAPKPKPTSAPPLTVAYCQSIMTVADANQIMNPPTPATMIVAQSDTELGVCSYTYPQAQFAVVKILVDEKVYTGPTPVPTSTIIQLVTELANKPGVTVSTTAPVSGVGDQAEFLAASLTNNSITFYADAFYVLDGKVAFMCDDFHMNNKPDDTAQLNALQQCAERVVSRLNQ